MPLRQAILTQNRSARAPSIDYLVAKILRFAFEKFLRYEAPVRQETRPFFTQNIVFDKAQALVNLPIVTRRAGLVAGVRRRNQTNQSS